jgi:hypothetical protein
MSVTPETKSTTTLAQEAFEDISRIVSAEVKLAKAEIAEKVREAEGGIASLGTSIAVLIPAITTLLIALSFGIAELAGIAAWISFAIVGLIAAIIGYALMAKGKHAIGPSNLTPNRTATNLKRDAHAVKEAI